jgi:hypothetical protein
MRTLQISVIIPAVNEESLLTGALESVAAQDVEAETIVVVNGSDDRTAEVARAWGARVVEFPHQLGYGGARNAGARIARGRLLVFLDADSRMGPDVLSELARHMGARRFGTVVGRPDNPSLRYRLFFLWKNFLHRVALFRGVLGGLFFCDTGLFRAIGGYDATLAVNENADIIARATAAGGEYVYMRACYATTSMRRFESQGFLRPLLFWAVVQLTGGARIGRTYASSHDRLYQGDELKGEMKEGFAHVQTALLTMAGGLAAALSGATAVYAAYRGPVAFVQEVFRERLMSDPSTPIIHFLMDMARAMDAWLIAAAGILLLAWGIRVSARTIRSLARRSTA